MNYYLTPEQVSPILGISPAGIRKHMRERTLDLGIAIPPQGKNKNWIYRIYRGKLNKIVGEDIDFEKTEG